MTEAELKRIATMASMAAVYVPDECEGIRITVVDPDEQLIYGDGEETGESYQIGFNEVDIQNDMFYSLNLIDPKNLGD